jgi:hypothetical protein
MAGGFSKFFGNVWVRSRTRTTHPLSSVRLWIGAALKASLMEVSRSSRNRKRYTYLWTQMPRLLVGKSSRWDPDLWDVSVLLYGIC